MQQDWGKAQPEWDHPPGMSTEEESQRAGYLAGRTGFSENSSGLSCLRSHFLAFLLLSSTGKFRLTVQTPAESPESVDTHSEKPVVVAESFATALHYCSSAREALRSLWGALCAVWLENSILAPDAAPKHPAASFAILHQGSICL